MDAPMIETDGRRYWVSTCGYGRPFRSFVAAYAELHRLTVEHRARLASPRRGVRTHVAALAASVVLAVGAVGTAAAQADAATACPPYVSHQGFGSPHRVNTLPALRWAARNGAAWFETDGFKSKPTPQHPGGVVMIVHQDKLPGGGKVSETPYERIRQLAPWMPTLGEMVRAARYWRILLLVEVKRHYGVTPGGWWPFVTPIAAEGMRLRAVVYSQFARHMADYRAKHPAMRRGLKAQPGTYATTIAAIGGVATLNPDDLSADRVDRLHAAGVRTVIARRPKPESAAALARFHAWGVDGALSNRPDLFRSC